MVGFSLFHIHPGFAVLGIIGCLSVMAWLLFAIPYIIIRREGISLIDITMVSIALFVVAAIVVPDNFFA